MPVIQLFGVSKHYRVGDQTIRALDEVDLSIEDGDFVSIIGPSGSGKSTLMHLLGCLDTPSAGRILIDGLDISRAGGNLLSKVRNEKIGFVFQSFNLLQKLDVLKNVELPMIYSGIGARERHTRAMEAIERVGLSDRTRNRPLQLSGGQCQRVAIARALVNRPRIILADEPTGNLDTSTGASIIQLFRELHGQGTTLILVTHDPDVAATTPKVIEMRDGRIQRIGPPLHQGTGRFGALQEAPAGSTSAIPAAI